MTDLAQLVSVDSRTPMQKLRRAQLHKVADALGIKYSPGAPKTALIKLLEANEVDVTQPIAGIQWQLVHPSPKAQQAAGMFGEALAPQLIPVSEPHSSARKGVNAMAVLSTKIAEKAHEQPRKKESAFQESRLAALEKDNETLKLENEHLRAIIEKRLNQLESRPSEKPSVNAKREYWQLYRTAKERGLPVRRGMSRADIEELIASAQNGVSDG